MDFQNYDIKGKNKQTKKSLSSPGDLPDPGIEPKSPAFQADALTSEPQEKAKANFIYIYIFYNFCDFVFFFNIAFVRNQPLLQIFNLCSLVFVINFVPLRTQSSVPIFTWEQDYWLECYLPLWTLLFLHQVASISSLPLLFLPNSVNLFVCSRQWRTLRGLITGWICGSPFDSPLYPPDHLCLLPPSSLLCITP